MNNLILVTPTKERESQVMEFREEMLKNGEGFYGRWSDKKYGAWRLLCPIFLW